MEKCVFTASKDNYYTAELYERLLSEHIKYIQKGGFIPETRTESTIKSCIGSLYTVLKTETF